MYYISAVGDIVNNNISEQHSNVNLNYSSKEFKIPFYILCFIYLSFCIVCSFLLKEIKDNLGIFVIIIIVGYLFFFSLITTLSLLGNLYKLSTVGISMLICQIMFVLFSYIYNKYK